MAVATLTYTPSSASPDNTQKHVILSGKITVGPGTYIHGGLALDSVLAPYAQTNQLPGMVQVISDGLPGGYIYQRIAFGPFAGRMMILQVPPSGSLTTASPLQELADGSTLSQVQADTISVKAWYKRNA